MSVLIEGMEMPTRCEKCRCCKPYENGIYCTLTVTPVLGNGNARLNNCPLVPVPPHGRLIDADELMLTIQEYIDEYGWDIDEHGFHSEKWCAMKETEMAINDVPTVIPADKDGEA